MALKNFCNKKSIIIGYTTSYMYEENEIVEQCWKMLATIKDTLLIDSALLVNVWAKAIDIANYFYKKLPSKLSGPVFISEKALTNTRQNLEHMRIFKNRVSIFIPSKKRLKSDVRKT